MQIGTFLFLCGSSSLVIRSLVNSVNWHSTQDLLITLRLRSPQESFGQGDILWGPINRLQTKSPNSNQLLKPVK